MNAYELTIAALASDLAECEARYVAYVEQLRAAVELIRTEREAHQRLQARYDALRAEQQRFTAGQVQ
jgi:hypothetical protein